MRQKRNLEKRDSKSELDPNEAQELAQQQSDLENSEPGMIEEVKRRRSKSVDENESAKDGRENRSKDLEESEHKEDLEEQLIRNNKSCSQLEKKFVEVNTSYIDHSQNAPIDPSLLKVHRDLDSQQPYNYELQNESRFEPHQLTDQSQNSLQQLNIWNKESPEKLLSMSKEDLIKYYEEIIDKCHHIINIKKDKNRQYKQKLLLAEFNMNRTQRMCYELSNQLEILKRDFTGRMSLVQREKDTLQSQYIAKEAIISQYSSAFEDLKCKNYQLENVAFTYHMTIQRLKEREIELCQKLEESQNLNRQYEAMLRQNQEDIYLIGKEKDQLYNDYKQACAIEDSLREEINMLTNSRIEVEKEINDIKFRLGEQNVTVMKLRNENDKIHRDQILSKNNTPGRSLNHVSFQESPQNPKKNNFVNDQQFTQPQLTSDSYRQFRNISHSMHGFTNQKQSYEFQSNIPFYEGYSNAKRSRENSPEQNPFVTQSVSPTRPSPQRLQVQKSYQEPSLFQKNPLNETSERKRDASLHQVPEQDKSLYEQNRKRQMSSQLGGVFNWSKEDEEQSNSQIQIRNIANDFRKRIKQDQNEPSMFQTPEQSQKRSRQNSNRRSCSYLGIGERDPETPDEGINIKWPSSSNHTPSKPRGSVPTLNLDSDDMNKTLTNLQLEKHWLESEYSKIKFSQISTNPTQKDKKQSLEVEMQEVDSKINHIKRRLRDHRPHPY